MSIDKIVLTKEEKQLLKKIRKLHKYKYDHTNKVLLNLLKYKLIERPYTGEIELGHRLASDYVQLTSNYERYKRQQLSSFIDRKVPIIISIIALFISILALLKQ